MKLFGKFLIVIGFFCFAAGIYLLWQRNNPTRIAFTNTEISANESTEKPVEIIIRSQNIDLPVIESEIVNYKWEVTNKGVSRIGNVYYGHNWTNLLGNLVNVKPKDLIEIKYANGKSKKYQVDITQIVEPSQKDVLNLANENTILIYTCIGFLDSKRFVVTASEIF